MLDLLPEPTQYIMTEYAAKQRQADLEVVIDGRAQRFRMRACEVRIYDLPDATSPTGLSWGPKWIKCKDWTGHEHVYMCRVPRDTVLAMELQYETGALLVDDFKVLFAKPDADRGKDYDG